MRSDYCANTARDMKIDVAVKNNLVLVVPTERWCSNASDWAQTSRSGCNKHCLSGPFATDPPKGVRRRFWRSQAFGLSA